VNAAAILRTALEWIDASRIRPRRHSADPRKWSAGVQMHWHPKPGFFLKDAESIALGLLEASKTPRLAMARLVFYINRAGRNLSHERVRVLEHAKEIIRGHAFIQGGGAIIGH